MAHNITSTDGLFVVREAAWHGLGNIVEDYITDWDSAREAAGLTWDVKEVPVFSRHGSPEAPTYRPIEGQKMVVRDDNGECLAIHNETYTPFSNADLGPLMEALVGEDDVQYETVGSLKGGRKVWALVRLTDPIEVPGDPRGATLPRLAIQNSHDGSGSLRAQAIMTRIVCDNTSHAADYESDKRNTQYVFRHTSNIHEYVEEAKRAVRGLRDTRENYLQWANDLLGIRISPKEEAEFIAMFFPEPPADVISDRVRANIHEARQEYRAILDSPTTPDTVRGTGYGLVQGAVEYLDHLRGYQSSETHFSRSYLNREPLKSKAERMVREVAGV